MIAAVQRAIARFRGTGSAAITLPPMDGALRPNEAIEQAALLLQTEQPDNLAQVDGELWFSRGADLWRLGPLAAPAPERMATMEADVSCLAADADGNLLAGLEDGRVVFAWGPRRGQVVTTPAVSGNCPTALLVDGDTLYVCHGSARHAPSQWQRDLMLRESSGSVWRVELATLQASRLATGLAFPCGIAQGAGGDLVVAEAWRHRLLHLPPKNPAAMRPVLDALPGYPGRLSPADGGGHWLCVFAPRSRLVEFVLSERDYCLDMLRELEPEHWIAPALRSGSSFLEPLQGGAVKQMGILKPWAPSRSYGLLVRLDAQYQPVASFHSRADGSRHGLTSCLQVGARVLVASSGGDAILELA